MSCDGTKNLLPGVSQTTAETSRTDDSIELDVAKESCRPESQKETIPCENQSKSESSETNIAPDGSVEEESRVEPMDVSSSLEGSVITASAPAQDISKESDHIMSAEIVDTVHDTGRESNAVTPIPAKRARGRPPKKKTSGDSRLKPAATPHTDAADAHAGSSARDLGKESSVDGMEKALVAIHDAGKKSNVTAPAPAKRGRGRRPKKKGIDESQTEHSAVEAKAVGAGPAVNLGDGKGAGDAESLAAPHAAAEDQPGEEIEKTQPTPKRRGRPPKRKAAEESPQLVAEESASVSADPPVRRGRGRPPKGLQRKTVSQPPRDCSPLDSDNDKEKAAHDGSAQGRRSGRMIKKTFKGKALEEASRSRRSGGTGWEGDGSESEDTLEDQAPAAEKVQRKRRSRIPVEESAASGTRPTADRDSGAGQPVKTEPEADTASPKRTVSKAPASNEDAHFKCLRCEEMMKGLPEYKRHLQTKHAAVYSKACPEGEQTSKAFNAILKTHKKIFCPMCQKPFRFAQYFKLHLEWCGREDTMAKCDICGRTLKAMWMEQHQRDDRLKASRKEEAERKAQGREVAKEGKDRSTNKRKSAAFALQNLQAASGEDSDVEPARKKRKKNEDDNWNAGTEQSEEEDGDGWDEDTEGGFSPRARRDGLKGDFDRRMTFPAVRNMDAFLVEQKRVGAQGRQYCHPKLLPSLSHWSPLSASEASSHLPDDETSVEFSVTQQQGDPIVSPAHLKWGEARATDSQATGFAGGLVRAMQWCPFSGSEVRAQVLAVAADRGLWERRSMLSRREGRGLIQFWSAGSLDSRQPVSPTLDLAFGLAHEVGHVTSLAWCPQGCDGQPDPGSQRFLDRLGLLAMAGSNSLVLIYSIPTLESLQGSKLMDGSGTKTDSPPIFKPSPVYMLACAKPEACGPCLSVAWQKGDQCQFIAAGYAKGFLQLWNLHCTSPSVRDSAGSLLPVRVLFAHHFAIHSIDWSPDQDDLFVTAGGDGRLKMWKATAADTSPVCTYPDDRRETQGQVDVGSYAKVLMRVAKEVRGPIRAVTFGSAALDAVIFADDQRDQYSGMVLGLDLSSGLPGPRSVINKHAAAIWDVSYSAWYDVVTSGDNTGLLSVASCWPLLIPKMKGAVRGRRGLPVFRTSCTYTSPDADKENEDGDSRLPIDLSKKQVHVTFKDYNMKFKKDFVNTEDENAFTRQTFSDFPEADVFCTSFNPNMASSLWVAAGNRMGFIRLLHLPCVGQQFPAARRFFHLKPNSNTEQSGGAEEQREGSVEQGEGSLEQGEGSVEQGEGSVE